MSLQIHEAFSYPAAYNNLPKNLNILHKSRLCLHFPLCPLFIRALSFFLFRFTEPNYSNEPEKSSERQRYERQNFLHEKKPREMSTATTEPDTTHKKKPFSPNFKGSSTISKEIHTQKKHRKSAEQKGAAGVHVVAARNPFITLLKSFTCGIGLGKRAAFEWLYLRS